MARNRYRLPDQETVALWLRQVPPYQPWRLEGPVRHWLRVKACLQGCPWARADAIARRLVARARSLVNNVPAPRGWDLVDDLPRVDLRECPICDRFFTARATHHVYCSRACHWRAARIVERPTILRRCSHCAAPFETSQPQKLFCGATCRRRAAAERDKDAGHVRTRVRMERIRAAAEREAADRANPRYCAECGAPLKPGCDPRKIYCSQKCNTVVQNRRKLNGHAKPNGHDHDAPNGSTGDRPEPDGGPPSALSDQTREGAGRERAPRLDAP